MAQMPLGYQCALAVVEHMDANVRYLLVARCHSLRSLHSLVPLKIHHLTLNTSKFTVDTMTHSIQTFIANASQIPRTWRVVVPPGGFPHDIDRFGHPEVEGEGEGDIVLQNWFIEFQLLMAPREIPPQALEVPPNFRGADIDMRDVDYRMLRQTRDAERRTRVNQRTRVRTYLQYTYGTRSPLPFPVGIKMAQALRQLVRHFFAPSKIYVKIFEVPIPFGIIRLTKNLKFQIQVLKTGQCATEVVNAFQPIVTRPRALGITVRRAEDPIFQHDLLKTIHSLSLHLATEGPWVSTLIALKVFDVETSGYQITHQELVIIGKHWINHPRYMGGKISFCLDTVETLLDRVREHLRAQKATMECRSLPSEYPNCGTVQITFFSEFNIYVEKIDQLDEEPKWKLVFEMMALGSAKAIHD